MRHASRHLAAFLLCSTALAVPAAAQDASDITYLGQIVIGYAEDGTPIFAGENATHLGSDDLRGAASTTDLDGLLRQQTSVFTQKDPGNPGVSVNIRGFEGSGRVAMSVDGVPQTYRLTGHAAQGYVFVDENLLAGVDVTRGPVTALGGSGFAGSADFRTLEAGDVLKDGAMQGGMVRLEQTDNGHATSGMAAAALQAGRFDMLFAASRHTGDDYADGAGATVANTYQDISSQLFKLGYDLSDSTRISFSLMHYESDFFATGYGQSLTNDIAKLGLRYTPGSALIDLRANVYTGKTETDWVSGTGAYVGRTLSTRTTGFDVTNTSDIALGAWTLTSANGIEASQDRLGGTAGGVNPTTGTAKRAALFSENVFANGPWEVTAGLRANYYSLKGTASLGDIDISDQSLDPKLTVAYQLTDWFQPYVTLSKGMRAPTLQETMLGGSHPGGGVGMVANPNLEPETEQGYEIGFNLNREGVFATGDRLTGRVNYYHMDVENYVVARFTTNSWGQTGYAFANLPGTSRTEGVEVELIYEHPGFDLGLSYTHNSAHLPSQMPGLGAGQYLPDDTLSLRLSRDLLEERLTLGAQYSYVSGGLFTDTYTTTAYQKDDSYELVDLFASYALTDDAVLYAKVTNVFDTVYVPWLSASATENGQGRTLHIGTSLRF
ncbi:hemoglobin/transferrin/lactoferrin receptor protein [Rhodobacter aestuarii]|uniref:Hemoglobin/transferrin/lactoferrin receptor protein n=1 Tax=Rhodobacter aestuarii TaxID=453582 RepID=A0A1N7JL32_9RHOB|nr:TonB-dependent receptor [Rhodobacter aestuarii]PTV96093.1 hemoglobin/transferrin/lactoferrin receptor protein [Rhodobacter aestuarii]SIS50015.1 hemoglobin/transferrin/lactoferrin receptor protein [Rhodobacter aestuarii]